MSRHLTTSFVALAILTFVGALAVIAAEPTAPTTKPSRASTEVVPEPKGAGGEADGVVQVALPPEAGAK